MLRGILALLLVGAFVAGCAGSGGALPASNGTTNPTPTAAAINDDPEPVETPAATPALKLPKSYAKLSKRDWAKVVKDPDKYIGKGYQVWGCITQFDAATGTDSFRADASYQKEKYWSLNGENAFFTGNEALLSDFVADDIVQMNVMDLGSYSYDTQAGGNTTVPLFDVIKITRKGSCD